LSQRASATLADRSQFTQQLTTSGVLNRCGSYIPAAAQTAPYATLQLEDMIAAAAAAMNHRFLFWGVSTQLNLLKISTNRKRWQ
jgi:hypothetical protein